MRIQARKKQTRIVGATVAVGAGGTAVALFAVLRLIFLMAVVDDPTPGDWKRTPRQPDVSSRDSQSSASSSCYDNLWSTADARVALRTAYAAMPPHLRQRDEHVLFPLLGQALLSAAAAADKHMVTLQMGGMDGVTNDPLWDMWVDKSRSTAVYTRQYWHPIVVEPVARNYQRLQENYATVFSSSHCYRTVQWAMRYHPDNDSNRNNNNNNCTFYTFDDSETAPPLCRNKPAWLRRQVGTLDRQQLQTVLDATVFDTCIVPQAVACGTATELLLRVVQLPERAPVALWQMDVEGYEAVLVPAMLEEFRNNLPVLIHYENKLLKRWDARDGTDTLPRMRRLLTDTGYTVLEGRQDDLAMRL